MNQTLWISIISSIVFILLGVILVTHPETSLSVISYIICILLVGNGIYQLIIGYSNISLSLLDGFSGGLLSIILGILILMKPIALAGIIPMAIGIWFIISSSYKLRVSLALRSTKENIWFPIFLMAVFMMICGIILLFNPLSSLIALTKMLGIFIILYSVIDIVGAVLIKRNINLLDSFLHEDE